MRLVSIAALLFALVLSPDALAGKTANKIPEIEATGIAEFDPTFMDIKAIHADLDTIQASLKSSNQNLATALNLPRNTNLHKSLATLKKQANNKLEYTLEDGNWPKLRATDAVSSDVQRGIDAVNGLVDNLKTSSVSLAQMPDQCKDLVDTAHEFPGQLNLDLLAKNNLTVDKLPTVAKKLKNNMKAVNATPDRVERVNTQVSNMLTEVSHTFPRAS